MLLKDVIAINKNSPLAMKFLITVWVRSSIKWPHKNINDLIAHAHACFLRKLTFQLSKHTMELCSEREGDEDEASS